MARTLCVWLPDWPLRRPDAPQDEPCQVVDEKGLIVAVGRLAASAGVRVGMRRREAEAICPGAVTLMADPGAETVAFESVVGAVESVVPRVEIDRPGLLYVALAGAVRYYASEHVIVDRVAGAVRSVAGEGARIGLADGPFAARMAAADPPVLVDDTPGFLSTLDVGTLGAVELAETLRWLGIGTLGDLASLPRAAIASRFGTPGLEAHRIAAGETRTVAGREVPEEDFVEDRFDPPIDDMEQGAFAARSIAARLGEGNWHRVTIQAESALGVQRDRMWRSNDPLTEGDLVERIRWQLQAWVESGGIPGGLARLRLVPGDLSDHGRQLRLDEDIASDLDARRALARAQALLGSDAVLQARPQGGRNSAQRVLWHRWDETPGRALRDPEAPWPGALPSPTPSLVPREPPPLEVEWDAGFPTRVRLGSRWETVLTWAGPWRSTGRWWDGEDASDRYQIVTSAGAVLCEVRAGRCYLTGIYD
jgi:protein ImuB